MGVGGRGAGSLLKDFDNDMIRKIARPDGLERQTVW